MRRLTSIALAVACATAGLMASAPDARGSDPVPPGTWTATSSMTVGRTAGTATVLDGTPCAVPEPPDWCGKVLAVGGLSASGYLDAAELYDPGTRTWQRTGGTHEQRWLHKAVLLPSGKVLVIGGGLAQSSAELYDPGTGRWTPTAPLLFGGLREFTATLMVDGRVLVTGGQFYPAGQSQVQVYDPAGDAWSLTTPMTVGRYNAVAVRLADGRVLVAGGSPGVPNAEVYDPVLATWTPTGPLARPFGTSCEGPPCSTATLLETGHVLVTGGDVADGAPDRIGDATDTHSELSEARRTSQLFDPRTLQWRLGPRMHQPRMKSTATRLADGRVLLAGGSQGAPGSASGTEGVIDPAEVYDPVENRWDVTGAFVEGRGLHDAVLLDGARCGQDPPPAWCGQVLAVGGARPRVRALASAELFDPRATTRAPSVLDVVPRSGPASGGTVVTITGAGLASVDHVEFGSKPALAVEHDDATPDSKLTVVAPAAPAGKVEVSLLTSDGRRSPFVSQASFTFYPSGEWTQSAAPAGRGTAGTLLSDPGCPQACGMVLVAGGPNGEAWLYDPQKDPEEAWQDTGRLHGPRFHHTQTLLADGRVLVVGGQERDDYTAPVVASAEIYDPVTGRWSEVEGPDIARRDHSATRLPSGHVLVTGGLDRGSSGPVSSAPFIGEKPATAHATAEIFNPATSSWSTTGALATGRAYHTAVLLTGPACAGPSAPGYCGTVLVAGGMDSSFGHLRTAEVYDAQSGSWSPTGDLVEPRVFHTMTLVARPGCQSSSSPTCTVVLVTGGLGGPRPSTEIYDPAAAAWRPSASLNVGRAEHAAVALADGTVLLAGGEASGGADATVEVIDLASQTSTLTGPMFSPRSGHFSLALTDGRALVAGGCCAESAELYESTRTAVPPSITAVQPVAVSTLGGTRVSLRGRGLAGRSVALRVDDIPVPPTFASDARVDFVAPRHAQGEVAVSAMITRADGTTEVAGPAELTYAAGTWRDGERADGCTGCRGRYLHTATALPDGGVLVAGGTVDYLLFLTDPGSEAAALRSAQVLDPATGSWSATAPMASGRFSHSATALRDGTVLVAGGQDAFGSAIRASELYDPKTRQWSEVGPLSTARFSHTATLLADGRVLAVGGAPTEERRDTPLPTAEIYDPATRRWSPTGSLAVARENHSATLLPGGSVLVAGGIGSTSSEGDVPRVPPNLGPGFPPSLEDAPHAIPLPSTEIFEPSSSSWRSGPPMAVARFGHTATVLSGHACAAARQDVCGNILVVGGSQGGPGGSVSTELFEPEGQEWSPVASLRAPRAGHAAALLADGTVLVAGGGPTFPGQYAPGPLASAEVFDPATGWRYTTSLAVPRAGLTLSGLPHGDVIAIGGYEAERLEIFPSLRNVVELAEPTEVYRPAPRIFDLTPSMVLSGTETAVTLTGTGLATADRVLFGDVAAVSFERRPGGGILAVAPRRPPGAVDVAVVNAGGTSARTPRDRASTLRYVGGAGAVDDLQAAPVSESEIELSFTAPDDGTGAGRATRYVVKQSRSTIDTDEAFEAAATVVGPEKVFEEAAVVEVRVSDLEPDTTYHYALRGLDRLGVAGPRSNPASATTKQAPGATSGRCAEVGSVSGAVVLPRRYSLVGFPGGTRLLGARAVFSWFNQGAGGAYADHGQDAVLEPGRGYWAWFPCPAVVAPGGAGEPAVTLPLGAYHASMVGNPSGTAPATVTGHDFAARWDPSLNAGAGGYHVSGYREAQTLAVGEGLWAFSYEPTAIALNATSG